MLFARLILIVTGLAFASYGFACLVSPPLVAQYSGMELPTVSAITEVVAMYGGLQLGVGLLFIVCAAHPTRLTLGLGVVGGSSARCHRVTGRVWRCTQAAAPGGSAICRC